MGSCGEVWNGVVRCGIVWRSMVRVEYHGEVWNGMVRCAMAVLLVVVAVRGKNRHCHSRGIGRLA